jgi:hypothetical protein
MKIIHKYDALLSRIPYADLPKKIMVIDLETRGGLKDFDSIEMLVGGAIEYKRRGKYVFERGDFESWEVDNILSFKKRLVEFDGLIIGMNLFGYDYRVLQRYFDVTPLIHKTFDFQHFLWRNNGGAVGLGILAERNTQHKKVPGSNMANYWDKGEKNYVLKRNRIDCELTGELYIKFLKEGYLNDDHYISDYKFYDVIKRGISTKHISRRSYSKYEVMQQVENTLMCAGIMCQYTAAEYFWRIKNHNGMRGDRRFFGQAWVVRDDYNSQEKSIFFKIVCRNCKCNTLLGTKNDSLVNPWLASLVCENCGEKYLPPVNRFRFKHVLPDTDFKQLSGHGRFWDDRYTINSRGYGMFEEEARSILAKIIGRRLGGWAKWHPDTEFWINRLTLT